MRFHLSPMLRGTALLGIALSLSACSGGLGSLFAPSEVPTYDLNAPQVQTRARHSSAQLVVAEPTALRALESDKVVVKLSNGQINYLDGAQWSDSLPKLLQARVIETLERSHLFRAVTRTGSGIDPDYQLLVDIRNFEIVTGTPSNAFIALSVRLVPTTSGRSVVQHVFEARVPVETVDAASGTAALNQALSNVLSEMTAFLSRR